MPDVYTPIDKTSGLEKKRAALLDRLGHHLHILTTWGSSYRSRKREPKEDVEVSMEQKRRQGPGQWALSSFMYM